MIPRRHTKTAVKSVKAAPGIAAIASFEALEPHIEKALTEQVLFEKRQLREQEMGGNYAWAGYFIIPARLAAEGKLDQARTSDMGLPDTLLPQVIAFAGAVPEEGRKLTRRK